MNIFPLWKMLLWVVLCLVSSQPWSGDGMGVEEHLVGCSEQEGISDGTGEE